MFINRRFRRGTVAALACAAVFTVGACSTDGSATGEQTTPTATKSGKELIVTSADLPAGYTETPSPESDFQRTVDQILNATKGADVDPPQCVQPEMIPSSMDVSQLGLIVATKGATSLAATVVPTTQDLGKIEKSMTGECAEITIKINTGQAAGATSTATYTKKQAPSTPATDEAVFEQKSVTAYQGQNVTTTTLMGWAAINGYTVSVTSGGLDTPDEAAFNDLFVKAVTKVGDATS